MFQINAVEEKEAQILCTVKLPGTFYDFGRNYTNVMLCTLPRLQHIELLIMVLIENLLRWLDKQNKGSDENH